ncbi:nucleoside deaminase [bacterium]|nr:nucleoside deaminase [bacterium]
MKPEYMKQALELAKTSGNDVPVGAVIVKNGEIIAFAVNEKEKIQDATAHAEILAIQRASLKLKNWRLSDCEMYVTLEPCPMCASAIIQSRVGKLYFGAYDLVNGAFGSKTDMAGIMGIKIEYFGGILEEECSSILKDYFKELR